MTATSTLAKWSPARVLLAPLRWLEQARGWRRRWLMVLYLIVGSFIGLLTWRAMSLRVLPDVGEPFDVNAFLAAGHVPATEDAFVLYRAAADHYRSSEVTGNNVILDNATWRGWVFANPEIRDWVEGNRPALDLWRQAAERPEAGFQAPESYPHADGLPERIALLAKAAELEGSRLQAEGDARGAWGWYRALLRTSDHLRARGRTRTRSSASDMERQACVHVESLALAPGVEMALLWEILEELRRLDDRAPPASVTMKAEYLALMTEIADPEALLHHRDGGFEELKTQKRLQVFLNHEPERSRRVAKLAFANWLAQGDRPVANRPKVVTHPVPLRFGFYEADPEAPAAARAMTPDKLFDWTETTMLWKKVVPDWPTWSPPPDPTSEGRVRWPWILGLAQLLYRLENGHEAAPIEALVPRYLKKLPDWYSPTTPAREGPRFQSGP